MTGEQPPNAFQRHREFLRVGDVAGINVMAEGETRFPIPHAAQAHLPQIVPPLLVVASLRQVVAGIAEAYAPETLIGRKVVIVANLAPRKLRGLESNGMIVAASLEGGKPVLAGFLEDVPVGARLK